MIWTDIQLGEWTWVTYTPSILLEGMGCLLKAETIEPGGLGSCGSGREGGRVEGRGKRERQWKGREGDDKHASKHT